MHTWRAGAWALTATPQAFLSFVITRRARPLRAYRDRNADTACDFAMAIANWEGQPITGISVLADESTCPSGRAEEGKLDLARC